MYLPNSKIQNLETDEEETGISVMRIANETASALTGDEHPEYLVIALSTHSLSVPFKADAKFIAEVLNEWRFRRGRHATLETFIYLLEHRCGWKHCADHVRMMFGNVEEETSSLLSIPGKAISYFPTRLIGVTKVSKVVHGFYSDANKEKRCLAVKQFSSLGGEKRVNEDDLAKISKFWSGNEGPASNLVEMIYCGNMNSVYILVTELASMNLKDLIDKMYVRERETLLEILRDVTNGLEFLHGLKIPHGNIKPENVLIFNNPTATGRVAKLSDYAVSGVQSRYQNIWTAPKVETVVSPFMESDIYSLGKLFYFVMVVQSGGGSCSKAMETIETHMSPVGQIGMHQESATQLLIWMMHENFAKRPSICQVSAHPFLWKVKKIMQFISDVGDMWWLAEVPKKDWRKICSRIDQSFCKYYLANHLNTFKRHLKFDWIVSSISKNMLLRNYTDPIVSSTETYEYDDHSIMSLVEQIRYNLKKHLSWRITDTGVVFSWFTNESQLSNMFSVERYAQFYLELCSSLPIILFFALTLFVNEPWMCHLNEKYSIQKYINVEECSEDYNIPLFMKFLKESENVIAQKPISVTDDESSDSDSDTYEQYYANCSLKMEQPHNPTPIESLVDKLPYSTDKLENVQGSEIFYYKDLYHRIGVSARNSILFKGCFNQQSIEAAIRLLITKECTDKLEKELDHWRGFRETAHIVKLLDWGKVCRKNKYLIYTCMERAIGNLQNEIANFGDQFMEKDVVQKYLKEIVEGLCYLHENQNISHGNISPTSILIFEGGNGKKIAKLGCFAEKRFINSLSDAEFLEDGIWMAPEILQDGFASHTNMASDIFSLGMVIHFCLSRSRVHPFDLDWRPITANIKDKSVSPRSLEISEMICADNLILLMLQKDPKERISSRQVKHHPLFWTSHQCLQFLQLVSENLTNQADCINNNERTSPEYSVIKEQINLAFQKYHFLVHDAIQEFNWMNQISPQFLKTVEENSYNPFLCNNYSSNSLLSLVEFICQVQGNLNSGLAPQIRSKFYDKNEFQEKKYCSYFLERFPDLLITLLSALQLTIAKNPTALPIPLHSFVAQGNLGLDGNLVCRDDWPYLPIKLFTDIYLTNMHL